MFKNLMTKIKTDLEREQISANGSLASSVSSSRLDLNTDSQTGRRKSRTYQEKDQPLITIESSPISDSLSNTSSNEYQSSSSPIVQHVDVALNSENNGPLIGLEDVQTNKVNIESDMTAPLVPVVQNNFTDEDKRLLKIKIDQLIKENNLLKTKIDSYQAVVNKASLAEKENSIILSELRQVRKLNQDLTAKNDELKRSNVDNEERNSKLLNKMDELKEKARDLINQNELLLDKNKKLLENESALTRQNHALNIEVEQLIQAKSDLEEQVQKSNQRERDEQESAVQRAAAERISHLESKLNQLQETIAEKNKTIRLQNQRISDIKKSVQKGDICLRDETSGQDTSDTTMENGFVSTDQLTRHQIRKPASVSKSDAPMLEVNHESYGLDINFQYLHNVIFKFITTYDQEAQKHLIKAIAKILQFTEEEEQTVKQSLEARNSWFRLADNFKF